MAQDIKAREAEDEVAPALKPIYERLSQMRTELDQLCECRTGDWGLGILVGQIVGFGNVGMEPRGGGDQIRAAKS